jgi:YD repeat-containing protein
MYSPNFLVVSFVRCLVILGVLLSTTGAPTATPVAQAQPKVEAQLIQVAPSLAPSLTPTEAKLASEPSIVLGPEETAAETPKVLPTPIPTQLLATEGSSSSPSPEETKLDMETMGKVDAGGSQLVSPDGRVTVSLPANAVSQAVEISYGVQSATPLTEETGTVLEFALAAQASGNGQTVDKFAQPVEVKVNLKGLVDLQKRAPNTYIHLGFKDEPPLPVQANLDENTVWVQVDRLGPMILSVSPQVPGVWALQYTPPSASLFNGSFTYQVPINVPPGRNGMQPGLSLSYSSGKLLGRTGNGYENRGSGPIGDAWSLDGLMSIARERWFECYTKDSKGNYNYYKCFDDIFVLTMNGTGYELTPVPAPPAQGQTTGRYYAKDAPGLYIERRNNCDLHDNRTGNCQAGHTTSNGGPSTTGEYWIVRTPDGQEARLGYTDAFQLLAGGNPVCNTQCKWGDAKTAYQGYKGQDSGKVTRLWAVDQITDPFGNKMTFTYTKDEWASSLTPRYIYYNYNTGGVAQSYVYLEGTDSYNNGSWINAIYAYNKDASGNDALVRYYVLGRITNSHKRWNGQTNVQSSYTTLAYVQEKDAGSTPLPAQTFAYEWYNSGDWHDLQWLAYVNNGYGATTKAVYEKAGGLTGFAVADGCNNYRLLNVSASNGFGGTPLSKTYTYGTPCFDYYGSECQSSSMSLCQSCDNGHVQTLVGYDVATEKVWDGATEAARSEHHFYNTNPEWRKGREWQVRQMDPATGYELARTETTWAQGSVQGTATAFGYVAQEQATSYTNNAPVGATRKSYTADWYGNVYAEYNYGAEIRLPDAGFEGIAALKTDCTQEGWSGFWSPNIPAARTGATAFAGSQSLQLSGSSTGGACQDVSGLTNGVTYQARVWVRAAAGTTGKFRLWLHDTTGANTQVSADIAPPTDGTWQQVIVPYTANAIGKVRIHLYYPITGTGTIYVDEVALAKATDVGDEASAQRAYYANTANGKWIVNKLGWQNEYAGITQNVGGSAMKRQTLNYYDGATAYSTPPAKGALTKSVIGLGSLWQTSQAAYDQWGNQTGTTDAGGHTTSTAYDTQYNLYAVSVTDASNKTATFTYDKVKGVLLSVTDANTPAATTSYEYDGFGRLLKIIKPYDSSAYPTTGYSYTPPQATSLYPNGDFEAGTGWTLGGSWSAGGINWWGYTAGQGVNSSKALQVNTHLYAGTADAWIGQAYGSWAVGQTHTIGAWVRNPSGGWVCMSVSNGINETSLSCAWAGSNWQYMGGQISLPAESTQMLLLFRFFTPSVTYYVDNVVMDGVTPLAIVEAQRETSGASGNLPTIKFYDGLGRLLQTRTETQDGAQQAVVNVVYDGVGRAKYNYTPVFESFTWSYSRPSGWDTRPRTVTAYDALGRVSQLMAADGTVTKSFYNGFQTATIDVNNHQKISVVDGWGRVVTIKEYNGSYATVNWDATPYATTSYIYDVTGNLTRVTDADGNSTNMSYDALGRKTEMSDPDMGDWVYRYDADGLLITQIDAKNQATNFYYDVLHRLIGKVYAGVVDRATYTRPTDPGYAGYTEKYYYDESGHGAGIGQRTSMSDANASTSWTYDLRGRVTQESKTVAGVAYLTGYAYDAMDRARTITYPTGEVVNQTYNAAAQLTSVYGTNTYASGMTYNALGQIKQVTLGNGAATTYDYYGNGGPAINSFRLWRTQTTKGGTNLMELRYGYDNVGNVKTITDVTNSNQVLTFNYDALDRLTGAATNAAGTGQYSQGFTYNVIGNIASTTMLGAYTYNPSGPNSVRPHAATAAGSNSYQYDANGNMIQRVEVNGTQRITYTQQWDEENRLKVVTATQGSVVSVTQFIYDGDGNRALRINPDGRKTAYVDNLLEVDFVPPAAPSNLSATAVSPSQINLAWTDNSNNEDGFRIERAPDGINWTGIITVGANATAYQNTGLTCGATYYYRVRAFNNVGSSVYSSIVNATTGACPLPPAPPSNLIATAVSSSQINLTWTDNSNNENGFEIERSVGAAQWTVIGIVSANVVTFSNVNLTCNTTYSYRVRAHNTVGYSPYSNIGSALTFLCAPSNLSASAAGLAQVNLSWTDNSTNESGFKIERSSDGGNSWNEVASVGVNVTTFSDSALACETTYAYRVWAFNQAGASDYSNTGSAMTGLCAPSNLVAQAGGSTQIALNWGSFSRQNSSRLGFKIERSTNETPWSEIATVSADVWTYRCNSLSRGNFQA